jgi:hypothetical protein
MQQDDPPSYDIFCAARAGDLEQCRRLVAQRPEIVNERYFDASPLFYASLCGHVEVVRFLLESGSCCAEETFDGDRAMYGALNDQIRALLRRYAQRRTFVLSRFGEEVSRLFFVPTATNEVGAVHSAAAAGHSGDTVVQCELGEELRFHRFVVAARCPQLARRFSRGGAWFGRARVRIRASRRCMLALMRYCYSDVLDVAVDDASAFCRLCRAVGLPELERCVKLELYLMTSKPTLGGGGGGGGSGSGGKRSRGRSAAAPDAPLRTVIRLHPLGRERMARDLGRGFAVGLLSDVRVDCAHSGRVVQLHAHRCILEARSEFFGALLSDEAAAFRDVGGATMAGAGEGARATSFSASHFPASVLEAGLCFLYTDGPGVLEILRSRGGDAEELLVALLDLACSYLLPELAARCAALVEREGLLRRDNCIAWLGLAELYSNAALRKRSLGKLAHLLYELAQDGELGLEQQDHPVLREFSAFLAELPDVARRDFYIAEAREELVEALPQDVPIAQRDAVTDAIEQFLGYRDSGAQLDYVQRHQQLAPPPTLLNVHASAPG